MIKGQYYYMEAVHKELFGNDVLQVAVQMENGQFIGPIGEEYLYFYYKSSKGSKSMTISQPVIKSNIFYCHTGLVLMNAIATQDCIRDPTFRHSSPSVFIRGDLMLKTQDFIYSTT